MGVSAIAGVFVTFISMDIFLVITVLLKPTYWFRVPLVLSLGSGVGSFALSGLIQKFHSSYFLTPNWNWASQYLLNHGVLALTALTISPLPLTPLVFLSASLGVPPFEIFLAVWIGRTIKYLILGRMVNQIPTFFQKQLKD